MSSHGRPGRPERRVVALVPRTMAAAKEAIQNTTRDRVAWVCLTLGILCGAGAVYYALKAMAQ